MNRDLSDLNLTNSFHYFVAFFLQKIYAIFNSRDVKTILIISSKMKIELIFEDCFEEV